MEHEHEQDNDNYHTIFQAVQRPASPNAIRENHSLWPSGPLTSLSREKPELLDDIPRVIGGEALDSSYNTFDEVHTMVRSASDRSCCTQWKLPGKESCLGWVWKVTSLPRVPQHAPLSICALRIEDLPVDTITSRVSDFLRVNSIGCRYPSGTTGRVDCCTSNCVKFVVQLWMSEDGKATILELQRRRGCSVLTKHIKDALFQSVRTGNPNTRYDLAIPQPSKQLQKEICKEMYTKDAEERCSKRRRWSDGQLNCINLLESPSVDKNQLGIEGLWCMTKAKDDWSHFVARSLILNEGSVANRLRQSFLALFSAKFPSEEEDDMLQSIHSNAAALSDDVSVVDKPPQEEAVDDTLLLALKTLVNCLESIETHQQDYLTNDSNKIKFHTPFWTRILKVLVFHLHQWSCYPQEAALSAKCLRILESLEPDGLSCFIEGAVVPLLPQVFEFGKAHHLALAEESEGLLKRCMEETSAKLMEAPQPSPRPPLSKPPLAPSTCCSTRETSYNREDTTVPEECTTVAGTETQDQSTQCQGTTASHGFFLPLSSFHSV